MKLRSSELSESTITVTNLGEGNVETVYGVIYPPQVAIVGFGNIIEQPWAESGMLDVRPGAHRYFICRPPCNRWCNRQPFFDGGKKLPVETGVAAVMNNYSYIFL